METTKEVIVNWNSGRSIRLAERAKSRLENSGYSLIKTVSTSDGAVLTYYRRPAYINVGGRVLLNIGNR